MTGRKSLFAALQEVENLTLGDLIDELELFPPSAEVEFDFVYAEPTTFDSYRGYYAQLALGYGPSTFPNSVTVGQLLDHCRETVGETMEGWKGGDYVMTRETPIWVANPREVGFTKLVAVGERYGDCVLITAPDDIKRPE